MAKIEIYCLVRKKMIKVDQRLGDALVKMKRATYGPPPTTDQTYKTRMMTADLVVPTPQPPAAPAPVQTDEQDAKAKALKELETLVTTPKEKKTKKKKDVE